MAIARARAPLTLVSGRENVFPTPVPSVEEQVARLRPDEPLHCVRTALITATAQHFLRSFPGEVLYAVKCNPEASVLDALHRGGVRRFDVASLGEIETVANRFVGAAMHFMHPVKPRSAIRAAYFDHGVRDFSLDSEAELEKIVEETGGARDLGLFIRLAMPAGGAIYDLSGKFGVSALDAPGLIAAARRRAARVGICFHVGSQCMDPTRYDQALALAGDAIARSGVRVDVIDVGGGFPVAYPDFSPPPLKDYVAAIERGLDRLPEVELWCEPGRALVAQGVSVVLQVQARRGDELFINDGIYGSLSDAGIPGFRFPTRLLRQDNHPRFGAGAPERAFTFWGPTCDSADKMAGPFYLPGDVREGDWIEIGQLGAYGACLRTRFNGFGSARQVEVRDRPLLETAGYPVH